MSDRIADAVRRIRTREAVGEAPPGQRHHARPSGLMVDYDDLERYFDILNVDLAPSLRDGRPVTIDPQSTVGRNIVHLTREDQ